MKNVIVSLLLAGFFSAAHAQDNSLLYEVSGNGLDRPSYLFGTFHMVCPVDLKVTDPARKALAESEQLYLELDLDDPSLQPAMVAGMMLGGGQNLRDFLNPDDYAVLEGYQKSRLGAGLAQLGNLMPLGLMSMMLLGLLQCPVASYDQTFADLAAQQGKPVLGLETVAEQLAVFDRIPVNDQLKGLVDMARKPDEAQAEILALVAAYRAQDLPLLTKLMNESAFDANVEGFQEDLLDKRNAKWIPIIERVAREKPTFFAFGAGHLLGPNGVLSLLRAQGYSVKPLL